MEKSAPRLPVKIVSGGQTGADRAALDVAAAFGLAFGGWVPRGRRAEDGRVPDRYSGMREAVSDAYEVRTELNVRDSDATLILTLGPPSGGTALTESLAAELGKPCFVLDLDQVDHADAANSILAWLTEVRPRALNVAGPRASEAPRIGEAASDVLSRVLGGAPG